MHCIASNTKPGQCAFTGGTYRTSPGCLNTQAVETITATPTVYDIMQSVKRHSKKY